MGKDSPVYSENIIQEAPARHSFQCFPFLFGFQKLAKCT